MSAQINASILKNFIVKTIGADKLARDKAQGFDIDKKEFEVANENDNNYLEIEEIMDSDLYEKFATLFIEEQDKKAEEADAEKEKEEKNKVKDKNGAGAA